MIPEFISVPCFVINYGLRRTTLPLTNLCPLPVNLINQPLPPRLTTVLKHVSVVRLTSV
jgi:hypothetical protein